MKKTKIFLILFLSIFILISGSSFVSAETRDFYFSINKEVNNFEPNNLFQKFIYNTGLNNFFLLLKARASQMSLSGGELGPDAENAVYSDNMIKVDDGGGGADDGHFFLSFPTENLNAGDEEFNYTEIICPGTSLFSCYIPTTSKKLIHPWRVFKVEVHTQSTNIDPNSNNCKMDAFITNDSLLCRDAGKNQDFYGASNGFCSTAEDITPNEVESQLKDVGVNFCNKGEPNCQCQYIALWRTEICVVVEEGEENPLPTPSVGLCNEGESNCQCYHIALWGTKICLQLPKAKENKVVAFLDEGNFPDAPANKACGHVRVDGGSWLNTKYWKGFLKATAVSPEFDDFGIKGKDANTGQLKTAKSGGSLEICNGENIEVFWETKDVISTAIVFGEVDTSTCGGCIPGQPKNVSFSGSQITKPLQSTNFSLVVKASTGDGPLNLSPEPVNVILKDCEEEEPVDHCDKLDDLDNETNPFCVDKYPQYGSKKKCCNWPENEGEFGDGCGKCEKDDEERELWVNLKINNSENPVVVDYNEVINLSWTSNAENCSIFNPMNSLLLENGGSGGSISDNAIFAGAYTLKCFRENESKEDIGYVYVNVPNAYIDLKANGSDGPITIDYNSSVNLTWDSQNVSNCVASNGWGGNKSNQGQETISNIISNKIFEITCDTDEGNPVYDNVVVNVEGSPTQTYVDLKGNGSDGPIIINYNGSVNLTWTSQNVSNCRASGRWRGFKPESGQETISGIKAPAGHFRIGCKDEDGNKIMDSVPVVVRQTKGNIEVFVRLNGEIVEAPDVSYNIAGPESFSGSGQRTFNDIDTGTYIISYNVGLPPSPFEENIEFSGYSPARTLILEGNQTIIFYLNFETLSTCNLNVRAELASCGGDDFQSWSGIMTYSVSGPINLNGTFAPQEFTDIPEGNYLMSVMSGPGIVNSILPSNPITCSGGATEEMIVRFEDCGPGIGGYRYSCNLQSQRCEICTGSVDECPFATLSECRNACGGGAGCGDEANITCWTNFDSNNCIGIIDGDSNPNVVLTNNLAGCPDISSCLWEIVGRPQYNQNSCAPFSWYDEPGLYTAKFTTTIGGASTSDTQDFEVRDIEGAECSFVWSPQSISVNTPIDFFDRSLSRQGTNIISWYWTFSGANISTSTNQIVQNVIFDSPGNKTITIEVENDAGDTCSQSQIINVRRIVPDWIEVIPD